jgi:hypothetical protein
MLDLQFPPKQRKPKHLQIFTQINKIAPPAWVSNALLSLFAFITANPYIVSISIAIWLTMLSTYSLAQLNCRINLGLTLADRRWIVPIQVVVVSFLVSPFGAFAQATGGGSCATAGFLNGLATFANQVFTPASGAGVTGTAVTALQAFMCTAIGLFVLAIIITVVGGIAFVGYQIVANEGQLATFGRPVAGMVFTVLLLVSFVAVATTTI